MSKHLIPELAAIVDTVATHLAHQRRRAAEGLSSGRFRTEDGCMCAIGCLIPDALYHPRLEAGVYTLFGWAEGLGLSGSPEWLESQQVLAKAVVAHLQTLAPSLEVVALRAFLEVCMIFHDTRGRFGNATCYQRLLNESPEHISDEDLKSAIEARLRVCLECAPENYASWWEARP